jgi:AcrR family transcriptional regulator
MQARQSPKTVPAPTRGYDNSSRRQKQADTKERIAAATAELHAVKGADKTSYADIAEHAGVSLPTVYSHFPSENDLFQGCTSHVGDRAPVLAVEKILGAPGLSAAIGLLVSEMEKQHLYFEPWLCRRMDSYIPFLADMSDHIRQQQTELVALVLRHFLGAGRRAKITAGCESMLCFDLWHRLVRGHRLSFSAARGVLVKSLLAVIEQQPASKSNLKQGSRKS